MSADLELDKATPIPTTATKGGAKGERASHTRGKLVQGNGILGDDERGGQQSSLGSAPRRAGLSKLGKLKLGRSRAKRAVTVRNPFNNGGKVGPARRHAGAQARRHAGTQAPQAPQAPQARRRAGAQARRRAGAQG